MITGELKKMTNMTIIYIRRRMMLMNSFLLDKPARKR
jgi:hypothetical protein